MIDRRPRSPRQDDPEPHDETRRGEPLAPHKASRLAGRRGEDAIRTERNARSDPRPVPHPGAAPYHPGEAEDRTGTSGERPPAGRTGLSVERRQAGATGQRLSTGQDGAGRLDDRGRRLVRDNLGLVGVHLKRFVPRSSRQRADREDLYQEGCLGLIEAGGRYDPRSSIPFAAYALARIHRSVSAAMNDQASLIRTPNPRRRKRGSDRFGCRIQEPRKDDTPPLRPALVIRPLPDHDGAGGIIDTRIADHPEHATTLRERLRDKHRRAVREAARRFLASSGGGNDRAELVSRLVEERRLVFREEHRTPLRQLSRDTRCSFAQVNRCDQALERLSYALLEADPEFVALTACASRSTAGLDTVCDHEMDREIVAEGVRSLQDRIEFASPEVRRAILEGVVEAFTPEVLGAWAGRIYAELVETGREGIWWRLDGPKMKEKRPPRNRLRRPKALSAEPQSKTERRG